MSRILIGTSKSELESQIKEYQRLKTLWSNRGNEALSRHYGMLIRRAKEVKGNPALHASYEDKKKFLGKTCENCGRFFEDKKTYVAHTIECY
jgi:hypothetical protein